MADSTPKSYATDPTLYLYTSLTAGSSHIVTATSRIETILKVNKIPFQFLDVATDEKARMLWGRRAGKKKLPGLVRNGMIVGDLEQIEDWNEYGELKENVGGPPAATASSNTTPQGTPSKPPPPPAPAPQAEPRPPITLETSSDAPISAEKAAETKKTISPPPEPTPTDGESRTLAMRQAGAEAAAKAAQLKKASTAKLTSKTATPEPTTATTDADTTSAPISTFTKDVSASLDNSAIIPPPSGTVLAEVAKEPPSPSLGNAPDVSSSPAPSSSSLPSKDADESAVTSPPSGDVDASDQQQQHRGSTVTPARVDEVKTVEQKTTIPEEVDAEGEAPTLENEKKDEKTSDEGVEKNPQDDTGEAKEVAKNEVTTRQEGESKEETPTEGTTKESPTDTSSAEKDTTSNETTEEQTTKAKTTDDKTTDDETTRNATPINENTTARTQDQPAKEGDLAGASVGD